MCKHVEPYEHQRGLAKIIAVQGIMNVDEGKLGVRILAIMLLRTIGDTSKTIDN